MKKLLAAMFVALLMVGCGGDGKSGSDSSESNQSSADNPPAKTDSSAEGKPFAIADLSLEMLWVKPGTFEMGSPTTEAGRGSNEAEHNVTLTKGFYLGKYEVTQAQYEAVMTGNTNSLSATPSNWPNNPNRPVEKVSPS